MKQALSMGLVLCSVMALSCESSSFQGTNDTNRTSVNTGVVNTGNSIPQGTTSGLESIGDLVPASQDGRSVEACFSYDSAKMAVLVATGQASHGHRCNRAVFSVQLSGATVGNIDLNNDDGSFFGEDGPSKFGGKFGGKWINGKFDVTISCALGRCHEDVTFLSIIGEVVTPSGKTKWLKINQGLIYPDRPYTYNFNDFQLSDVKPTFGTYCELQ